MRTFIAIEVPPKIREALADCRHELERLPAEASWTRPVNIHLTLRFLGEVEEKQLAAIARAMQGSVQGIAPFPLHLSRLGAFPNLRRPRVLWAGLAGEIQVAEELQARLEERLEATGFACETKAFHPHLTLARLKSVTNPRLWSEAVDQTQLPQLAFEVQRIVLFQSKLHPGGAQYTELAEAFLTP